MRRPVVIAIAVAVLAAGAVLWWRAHDAARAGRNTIRGSGMIEVTQVDVAFEVGGRVVERPVDEGYLIDKGEPVARLDEREYLLRVEQATAAKSAADARYHLLLKGSREQQIDEALAAVEAAESDLSLKRADYRRNEKLVREGIVSAADFDRSTAALQAAEAALDQARQRLDMLKEGSRTEEIEEARARLHEAEEALALAELNLSRTRLMAPLAGRVLTKSREVGEVVRPGDSIVTIGDLTRPWLNIYIGERDLGRVSLGMPAQVVVDSFPTEPFPGKVTFISEKAEFTPKNIQTQDERVKLVYRVKIDLENRDQQLKPGMPADAVLHVDGTNQATAEAAR